MNLRRLSLTFIIFAFCFPNFVYSQNNVQVIVLPFEVHAEKAASYLRTEVSQAIQKHLKENGATILIPEKIPDSLWQDQSVNLDQLKNFGLQQDADFIIKGSLTKIDKQYSLDVELVETFKDAPPALFFQKGEGIENLPSTVEKLSRDLAIKILKKEKVSEVIIAGNNRIESDAILRKITTKKGDIYLAKSLSQDLKTIYAMGYFDDIRIEAKDSPKGKTITFKVKEKPNIRMIRTGGNKIFDDEEIIEAIDIKTGSILNTFHIQKNVRRIEELYKDKNYHNVKVTYNIKHLEKNQADLEFNINEGEKTQIQKIIFVGNHAYSSKKLKKVINTSEKGFFSWITSSGDLNMEDLNQDIDQLTSFYQNNGYIQVRVSEPQIEYKENWISITIKLNEGPQFTVGKVDISGDLIASKEELLRLLDLPNETNYNRQVLRNDILKLTDFYSDQGYAYADINPEINQDFEKLVVHLNINISKGKQVYFEKIIINGNTKTRDKVIRRELHVYEQELFSGSRLKRGIRNLYRQDFFEDLKVDTVKGSSDDKMILQIDVTEKNTGTFSIGGGYSTTENVYAVGSISQRNLFGRGQTLELQAELGATTTLYTLKFVEPWLFDTPLRTGVSIYNWEKDYISYDKKSKGGSLRFSYPVYNFVWASIAYKYDIADVYDIEEDASESIKDLEGENTESSVATALIYDSRDKLFNTTRGQDHSITFEYAGLGGDIGFNKLQLAAGFYIPLFKETVGFLHGKTGYVVENSNGILPDYERFYLGGINSMRGFDFQGIHATDEEGKEIGGDKFIQFNFEYHVPVVKQAGVVGVVFLDIGNVYNDDQSIDFSDTRESAGAGIRWFSPVGPIRLEYGYILDHDEEIDGSKTGRWEFTMGSAF